MTYHIHCNCKTISPHYGEAIQEFAKRLSSYCNTTLNISSNLTDFLSSYKREQLVIWVQSGPSTYNSEEFAGYIHNLQQHGQSIVHILIGYPSDVLSTVYEAIHKNDPLFFLSITGFHLPSDTVCLLFHEQLYRAYTILQGKTYHK